MEANVRRYVRENGLLRDGQSVTAALSGGADSTALLLCLRALGYTVSAAHLNHRLRGEESDRDEQFVRALCARLHVPLRVGAADVAALARESGRGLEETAREVRYRFLTEAADALGGEAIATAHTADDNLETVLFHLGRGTGTRGMAGIPPVRERLVRPLLCVTRDEVERYLAERAQNYVTDSTNASDAYTRNRLRHTVVPPYRACFPDAAQAARRMSEQARQDCDCLDGLAQTLFAQCMSETEPLLSLRLSALRQAHPALQSRVLRLALRQAGIPLQRIGRRHYDALLRLLAQDGEASLPGGFEAVSEDGALTLGEAPAAWEPVPVSAGTAKLPNGRTFTLKMCGETPPIYNSFNTFLVSRATIDLQTLAVRPARAEDRLFLAENRGERTVRRLCADRRIPRRERGRLLAVIDRHGLIAVEKLGLSRTRSGEEQIEINWGN